MVIYEYENFSAYYSNYNSREADKTAVTEALAKLVELSSEQKAAVLVLVDTARIWGIDATDLD